MGENRKREIEKAGIVAKDDADKTEEEIVADAFEVYKKKGEMHPFAQKLIDKIEKMRKTEKSVR